MTKKFVDPNYQGQSKINLAFDPNKGEITEIGVSGWETEYESTQSAFDELDEIFQETHKQVLNGELSTLAYHMRYKMLDPGMLADESRLWAWQVKRHIKSQSRLEALSSKIIEKYCKALNLSKNELLSCPEKISPIPQGERLHGNDNNDTL